MYRRRRCVLVGWIVLLIATFMLSSSVGGAFKTEFKLPGTESQAAFDLLEKSSFRNRQVQAQIVFAANDGVDDAGGAAGDGGLFAEVEQKIPNVDVVEPLRRRGRAADRRATGRSRTREVNFADRSGEAFTDDGKEIKQLADRRQRARAHRRVRRRHVRRPRGRRRERGHRSRSRR